MTQQDQSLYFSEAHVFIEIEQFIQNVMRLGKKKNWQRQMDQQTRPWRRLYQTMTHHLPRWLSFLTEEYAYTEYLSAFVCAVGTCSLRDKLILWGNKPEWRHAPAASECLELIQFIIDFCHTKEFKRKIHDRKFQLSQNEKSLVEYASRLHTAYSRLEVVRVDLGYLKVAQPGLTIHDVYKHLKLLLKRVSNRRQVFEYLAGYAYAIEQGEDKSYHIHAIFYFKGYKVQSAYHSGQQITDIWNRITLAKGHCYNCNASMEGYENRGICGIGRIERHDQDKINKSIRAACYLTQTKKRPQHLRARPHGARSFNTGSLK